MRDSGINQIFINFGVTKQRYKIKKEVEMFGVQKLPILLKHSSKRYSTLPFKNINSHIAVSLLRRNVSVISHVKDTAHTTGISYRYLTNSAVHYGEKSSSAADQTRSIGEYDTLTEYHAYDMIHKLSDNDRASLSKALNRYGSEKVKSKLQGNFSIDVFSKKNKQTN